MSWPLASFALVGGALIVGGLAYERARPSARTIALVATLAALAALGRDAFVALPDVKPITAMTLVVGYALGPLQGFMVGALGMLASNVLLGQGPYTPWQMAAWGLVGLLGALIGRLSGRRLSRLALAVSCALTALVAKEIMNVYVFTLGGVYTPAALLARVGEGLPFDLTDISSSFLFGLAFAPELARLLARVRARMHVRFEPARDAVVALAVATALAASGVAGAPGRGLPAAHAAPALGSELSYLEHAQQADGGFGGAPGERSSELYSAWAAMGLAAAGRDPSNVARDGHSVLDGLRAEASTLEGAGDMERTMLALHACGVPAGTLGDLNLEATLLSFRRPDGSFDGQVNLTAFAIFALLADGHSPGEPMVHAAGRWLEGQQNADGGFSYAARGAVSDVDDTAAALQAIVAARLDALAPIARAVSYLVGAQNPDGGFPQQPHGESNAQSTAWAVQALIAAGRDIEAVRNGAGPSPLGYLQSLVASNGSVRYSPASAQTPVWVTAEAMIALAGKPFPLAPVRSHGPIRGASASAKRSPGASRGRPAGHARTDSGPTGRADHAHASAQGGEAQLAASVDGLASAITSDLATLAHLVLERVGVGKAPTKPSTLSMRWWSCAMGGWRHGCESSARRSARARRV